jgi:O-antigen ligase
MLFCCLLALIFARPFIPSLAYPQTNTLYSILLLAVLSVLLVRRGAAPPATRLKYPLAAFLAAVLLSFIFSRNKFLSALELYKYAAAALILLACSASTEREKGLLIKTILLSGLFISLTALYHFLFSCGRIPGYLARQGITDAAAIDLLNRRRAFFPFITPNLLAGYLAMLMPLAFTQRYKIPLGIILFTALAFTQSIGAIFSLLVAAAVYLIMQKKNPRRWAILATLAAAFLCVLLFRLEALKIHHHPAYSIFNRLRHWQATLAIIKESPLVGIGIGGFCAEKWRFAHNSYLQLWAEAGILGLASFLWLVYAALKPALKKDKAWLPLAAAAVFLIHNLVDFSFFLPEVNLIWWAILGALV